MNERYPDPGPELDALVAEKVMDWPRVFVDEEWPQTGCVVQGHGLGATGRAHKDASPWSPSTRIEHAWEVVERLRMDAHEIAIFWDLGDDPWRVKIEHNTWVARCDSARGESESAPHAICIAALEAVQCQTNTDAG